jgi:histidinol-phosphate/aromatic aminotransferase/cobyric acid decarboxylase-like protein
LRAGYVIAPNVGLAARIRDRQPRWSVNALACETIPELLARADLPVWRDHIAGLRSGLVGLLETAGLHAEPSDAPYVLVRDAPRLRDHLALDGVLIRDTSSFGIIGGVRIAVPDEAGLQRLADGLAGWRR